MPARSSSQLVCQALYETAFGAFANPDSYFHRYAALTDTEAIKTATGIWDRINGPNLIQNVLPTRGRAN